MPPLPLVIAFRTPTHQRAAEGATDFLAACPEVDAVTLVGSATRRPDANDLDISALVSTRAQAADLQARFAAFAQTRPEFQALADLGPFVALDFHTTTGNFAPKPRGWTDGPDAFELEIGNEIAYSATLWERGHRLADLRQQWLPFYDDTLRATRLADARKFAINDLEHIPLMLDRDEPFHAFQRLYMAFQEFLQALFIARCTYPIAYDKWIQEQVSGILGLPELYEQLPSIIGVPSLSAEAIAHSSARLRVLLDEYACD